jgi:hypothetical protein
VQLPSLVPGRRAQPEGGHAVGSGQADDQAVAVREAHRLAHPDRGEGAQIEVERRLDVLGLQADVIEQHARSLATRPVAHRPGLHGHISFRPGAPKNLRDGS